MLSSLFLIWIGALICLVTAPFDKNRRILHYFACWWGNHYMYVLPGWHVHWEGKDYIDSNKTYVLIANHQSLFDILVLYGLYKPFKWVSKESIYKVPAIGQNMMLNQYVCIKRGDMKSIKEMIAACKHWLNRGVSIMMFPEGTRSETGEMQPFRDGSFRLSVDCDVPIIPIVISGTGEILPKKSRHLKLRQDVWVKILPPVYPKDFEHSSGKMRTYVHELMSKTLDEMRKEHGQEIAKPTIQAISHEARP
jgi:1-acyl-sn-glycerol-3-phosphate acyltransferase